ncbi:hypothetical protein HYQ19_gp072 [Arthrobacter phage DrYang]|uniref:Uncharacterized protein n=1 Tax=Arthrobacter phage DrYang TaxID=2686080 RepID=A0A6B9J7K6_9CAUD|nr:hypothetical protein HYQ19_gp072 [Arthrobacter phage DrYang]QGZ17171.1 hypothetical protein SEA_DRYANG_72 [Arthrobacter phage DrYang]
MRTEPLPHEDPVLFELARDIFIADNAAARFPHKEWEEVRETHTAYAFGIAAGLIRRGYHKNDVVRVEEVRTIIGDLIDPDPCDRDHGGGCQAHGYIGLGLSATCPQQVAKDWLEAHPGGDAAKD